MQLLVILLNREDFLDDILAELLELEVTGASVVEGIAMERVLAKDVPIFAGLLQTTQGSRSFNKNIFAVIKDGQIVDRLMEFLKELDIDMTDPNTGILFTLPIDYCSKNQ